MAKLRGELARARQQKSGGGQADSAGGSKSPRSPGGSSRSSDSGTGPGGKTGSGRKDGAGRRGDTSTGSRSDSAGPRPDKRPNNPGKGPDRPSDSRTPQNRGNGAGGSGGGRHGGSGSSGGGNSRNSGGGNGPGNGPGGSRNSSGSGGGGGRGNRGGDNHTPPKNPAPGAGQDPRPWNRDPKPPREPRKDSKPDRKPDPAADPKTQREPKPDLKPDPKAKPGAKPDAKPDAKTGPKGSEDTTTVIPPDSTQKRPWKKNAGAGAKKTDSPKDSKTGPKDGSPSPKKTGEGPKPAAGGEGVNLRKNKKKPKGKETGQRQEQGPAGGAENPGTPPTKESPKPGRGDEPSDGGWSGYEGDWERERDEQRRRVREWIRERREKREKAKRDRQRVKDERERERRARGPLRAEDIGWWQDGRDRTPPGGAGGAGPSGPAPIAPGPASLPPAPEPHTQRPGTSRPEPAPQNQGQGLDENEGRKDSNMPGTDMVATEQTPDSALAVNDQGGGLAALRDEAPAPAARPAAGTVRRVVQQPMAMQHRTDITLEEYLTEIAAIADGAKELQGRAAATVTFMEELTKLLLSMAGELGEDHNIDSRVTDGITTMAGHAPGVARLCEAASSAYAEAAETALEAARRVAALYQADMEAVHEAGLLSASAARHHE
ncbi:MULTISPECIES: hypothetical protein [Streptomyces]|nr:MULTISPECIES: hypothetical protein [Streptomyces]